MAVSQWLNHWLNQKKNHLHHDENEFFGFSRLNPSLEKIELD